MLFSGPNAKRNATTKVPIGGYNIDNHRVLCCAQN
jgi:hypothetical protein